MRARLVEAILNVVYQYIRAERELQKLSIAEKLINIYSFNAICLFFRLFSLWADQALLGAGGHQLAGSIVNRTPREATAAARAWRILGEKQPIV